MPVLPKESETGRSLPDQIAKESQDSQNKSTEGVKATIEHHKANLGPQIAQNLGEPASKEELKKRAKELNK